MNPIIQAEELQKFRERLFEDLLADPRWAPHLDEHGIGPEGEAIYYAEFLARIARLREEVNLWCDTQSAMALTQLTQERGGLPLWSYHPELGQAGDRDHGRAFVTFVSDLLDLKPSEASDFIYLHTEVLPRLAERGVSSTGGKHRSRQLVSWVRAILEPDRERGRPLKEKKQKAIEVLLEEHGGPEGALDRIAEIVETSTTEGEMIARLYNGDPEGPLVVCRGHITGETLVIETPDVAARQAIMRRLGDMVDFR